MPSWRRKLERKIPNKSNPEIIPKRHILDVAYRPIH